MVLFIAWLALAIESVVAVSFGVFFWRVWSRSAMSKGVAAAAITAYGLCSAACLLLTFFVPL